MGKEEDVHVVRLEGTWNEEGRVRGSSDVGGWGKVASQAD